MRIGRWSELSIDRAWQEHEVMRDAGMRQLANSVLRLAEHSWGCQNVGLGSAIKT